MRNTVILMLTALLAMTPAMFGCSDKTDNDAPTEQSAEDTRVAAEEAAFALEDPTGLSCEDALAYAEAAGYEYAFQAPSGYDVINQVIDESGCYTASMQRAKVVDYDFTEGGWFETPRIWFGLSMPIAISPDDDQVLRELIESAATDEATLRDFADDYEGKVIEFNCWCSGWKILDSYYRDYHFAPGTKDQGTHSQFVVCNTPYSDLEYVDSDEHLRTVMVESPQSHNMHLIALVNGFNEEYGQIDVSPVESWIIY